MWFSAKVFYKKSTYIVLLITALIFFFSISFIAQSKNAESLNIEVQKTKKLESLEINKILILNPEIAKAEKTKNGLIITGLSTGKTNLYIWKNKEILTYIINITSQKINLALLSYKNKNLNYGNLSYGYIGNNFVNRSSNKNLFETSIIKNYLNYYFPFYDGKITTYFSNFSDFSNNLKLGSNYIDNFIIDYRDKNLKLELGDISSSVGAGFINNFTRGLNLSYTDSNKNLTLFGGVPRDYLYLYKNNTSNQENIIFTNSYGTIGGHFDYNYNNNLNLFTSFQSELLKTKNSKIINDLLIGFKYKESKVFSLESQLGTNFNKINNYTRFNYHNEWEKTKEFIDFTIDYRKKPEGVTIFDKYDQDIYSISLGALHVSKTYFNISSNIQVENNLFKNIFTAQIVKPLTEKISLNGNYTFVKYFDNGNTNIFQMGSNFNYFIPLNISYTYSLGKSFYEFQSNRGTLSLFFFNNQTIELFSNLFYESKKDYASNLYRSLDLFNLTLSSNINIDKVFRFNSNFSYNSNLEKSNELRKIQNLSSSNILEYKLEPYHSFSLNFSTNTEFIEKKVSTSINTLLSYTYYFGEKLYYQETKGKIKGVIFEDINNNGIFDLGEKTFENVKLSINKNKYESKFNGYESTDLDYNTYTIDVINNTLPKGYKFMGGDTETILLNEKEKIVNFAITNKNTLRGIVYKNKKQLEGLDSIKVILDNKYEYETDSDGYFSFFTETGEHTLKIDPFSIPKNYTTSEKINKKIVVANEKENNITFTLFPIITFKGVVLDSQNNQPIPYEELTIKLIVNNTVKTKIIKSNEKGDFFIRDLEEGELEISSKRMKNPLKIKITNELQSIKQNIYFD